MDNRTVTETYNYWLSASAGGTTATLKIYDNNEVDCNFHWAGMGTPFHYLLSGKVEPISETYGLIRIQKVEDVLQPSAAQIPIEVLGAELIYEYIKVPHNSSWRHPDDALWVNGVWNEFFDLILFTSDFIMQCFDSLKYSVDEGIVEEIFQPELTQYINDVLVKQLALLVVDLDKTKFARTEK